MLRARPIRGAPHDGTLVRLLVEWTKPNDPEGPWAPLEDNTRAWTVGFNSHDHTGLDFWQFVGWSWQSDEFLNYQDRDDVAPVGAEPVLEDVEGVRVIGWLPLMEASTDDPVTATPAQAAKAVLVEAANDFGTKLLDEQDAVDSHHHPEDAEAATRRFDDFVALRAEIERA